MKIHSSRWLLLVVLGQPLGSFAATLDTIYEKFRQCDFNDFFYAPWDTHPLHPYLAERNLKPYKEVDGLYYFKVKDTLFGFPVSEIIIPGTWGYHGVVFDIPLPQARLAFKQKFGTSFTPSKKSAAGKVPALEQANDKNKSLLYCNEEEEGL